MLDVLILVLSWEWSFEAATTGLCVSGSLLFGFGGGALLSASVS